VRIATWNVNSLKARLEKVEWWLQRAAPDVLLLQETKLADADAPLMTFSMAGYELVHHGEGRWNGVAIAVRQGLAVGGVVTNFGDGPVRDSSAGTAAGAGDEAAEEDFNPFDEARMLAATIAPAGGEPITVVSLYAPNGRVVDSPFYRGKLDWFARLRRWLDETQSPEAAVLLGGDLNVAPTDEDVWDAAAVHGATHVSALEREAFQALLDWGLVDAFRRWQPDPGRYTWWDYRAGNFHKNLGMRIDHLLVTSSLAARSVAAEVDREARKGPPTPSDHAPVVLDLDEPGRAFDADWSGALARIAARSRPRAG
jgi:exodeoxyribonuclease-3